MPSTRQFKYELYSFDNVDYEKKYVERNSKSRYSSNPGDYKVVQGDTLYSISKRFNITVDDLKQKNRRPVKADCDEPGGSERRLGADCWPVCNFLSYWSTSSVIYHFLAKYFTRFSSRASTLMRPTQKITTPKAMQRTN